MKWTEGQDFNQRCDDDIDADMTMERWVSKSDWLLSEIKRVKMYDVLGETSEVRWKKSDVSL